MIEHSEVEKNVPIPNSMSIQKRKKYTKFEKVNTHIYIYNFLNPKIKFSVATFNGCEVKR
jgi:hypothetical protein